MTATAPVNTTEHADGMMIDWDVPITMDDGTALRADVFRPTEQGRYAVILTYGPYAKWLSTREGYPGPWKNMVEEFPDALEGTSNKYQSWEVPDPEKWVPDGYVCVRVDSRGSGRSPGLVDPFSKRETKDFYDCIEWAGGQAWSNGKVGLAGISYYAINQWQVAAMQPPHLMAICPWEGAADFYRDGSHQGGIPSAFWRGWYGKQCNAVQHGLGERGYRSTITEGWVSGDVTMSPEDLASNRVDFGAQIAAHPLDDDYHATRSGNLGRITVPVLSSGNWGGQGLHLRGNTLGYECAASEEKWLEMHGGPHWAEFYTPYGVEIQKRFFGHFLKGEATGWDKQPPVQLLVRHATGEFIERHEQEWPLERTKWTRLYLDAETSGLHIRPQSSSSTTYRAQREKARFSTGPLPDKREITGPLMAKLFLSSTTKDADVFVTVHVFDTQDEEVVFQGALDPHTPVAQGWLRASHRELDIERSTPYRPFHTHRIPEPIEPGMVHELDIEILPTSIVIPEGYRIVLTVSGSDYVYDGEAATLSMISGTMTGCGPFIHPERNGSEYSGDITLHTGDEHASYLLVPIIPN